MELDEAINTRRSIRKYNPSKLISAREVKELIKAAQAAPSWKNSQTARYYAVISPKKVEEFRKECLPQRNAKNTENAAYIVTTFVKNVSGFQNDNLTPDNNGGNLWGAYDLGLANENLLLKAKEMGYDTIVLGIRDEDAIRDLLDILEDEEIMAVIAVGKSDQNPLMPKRKELDEVVKIL